MALCLKHHLFFWEIYWWSMIFCVIFDHQLLFTHWILDITKDWFFLNWVLLVLSKSVMLWLNLCYIPHFWLSAQSWALVSNLTLFTALCKSFSENIPSDTPLTRNMSMGSSYLMHNASFTLFPNSFLIFYHIVNFFKSIVEFSYYFSIHSPFCFIPSFYFIMNNFNLSKKIDPCLPPYLPK